MAPTIPLKEAAGKDTGAISAATLQDANINPESHLATDYLNHYNEIVMLMEMVPDMPELAADLQDWEPKSYQDHVRDSGLPAKELAIQAYDQAPPSIRAAFEAQVDLLDGDIMFVMQAVGDGSDGQSLADPHWLRDKVLEIQASLAILNGIIHGKLPTAFEAKIEAATEAATKASTEAPAEAADAPDDATNTQADIDALFD